MLLFFALSRREPVSASLDQVRGALRLRTRSKRQSRIADDWFNGTQAAKTIGNDSSHQLR
jgi:hypothetical protein